MNRDKEDALSMVWENRLDFSEPGDARLGPDAEVYTAAFNSTLKHKHDKQKHCQRSYLVFCPVLHMTITAIELS